MYYENRKGSESMSSNISRVDDSFTDFIPEAKFENNVTKLLGSLAGVDSKESEKEKEKTTTTEEEEPNPSFIVYFDMSLYVAPPVIVRLEDRLAMNGEEGAYKTQDFSTNIE